MIGSMFIGLSGMQAYSNGLREISNNITNLNSLGFKSSDLSFSDVYGGGYGLGYGVSLSDARLDFGQGELRQSDNDLDLAIDGGGFLVLLKDADTYFARTGSFEVNDDGFIVLAGTDYRLSVIGEDGNPSAVSINAHRTSQPQATATVTFADNLSSTATEYTLPDVTIFNELGETQRWSVKFEKDTASTGDDWTVIVTNEAGDEIGRETLSFISGIVDPATRTLSFSDTSTGHAAEFDFSSGVTSFSSGTVSTLRASEVDGYGVGEVTSLRVNAEGILEIGYSNNQTVELGAVSLANVRDPNLLGQLSGGLFSYDAAAGVDYQSSAHEGVGRVLSNRLEASNVDLSAEFGDLILVQRGYQASSQVVSVSNDMIQQLFGLRGQG